MGGGDLSNAVTWPRRLGFVGLCIVVLDQQVRFIIIHGCISLNHRFQIKLANQRLDANVVQIKPVI